MTRSLPQRGERWLPLAYFVAALLLVVFTLPTVLRPPQQPPTQSAELSPDAPPDDQQQSIISSLDRANSATAGATDALDGTGAGSAPAPAAEPVAPRACPRGVGNPARQVLSYYSAPCAPAFSGGNGGDTYQGVTATEIRIAYSDLDGNSGVNGNEGPVSNEAQPGESDGQRQLRVYQEYFNRNFQLWGRRIQLYVAKPASTAAADVIAAVQRADEEYKAFAILQASSTGLTEAARRQMVAFGGFQLDGSLYEKNQPYLYAWWMDGTRLLRILSEYICKQLVGKPARFAGDDVTRAQTRKFGILSAETTTWGANPGSQLPGMVKAECGEPVQSAVFGTFSDPAGLSTAMARMRQDGVTTIVPFVDPYTTAGSLAAASATNYYPEWLISGYWEMDAPSFPTIFAFDPGQWSQAFGLSPMEMARPQSATDWYQAYREIDGAREPNINDDGPFNLFYGLLQLANGIQAAGPNLTPETFRRGLHSLPRHVGGPIWTHGGGYGPGDPSYGDDVTELYFDPDAPNPWGSQWVGAYRYPSCGARWGLGQVPRRDPEVFAGGCTVPPGEVWDPSTDAATG